MENSTAPAKLNLYQKLHIIQQRVNGLGKDKAAFGYKYVTGDKVLEHIKPVMNEVGVLLKQEILSIENTRQDYTTKQGAKSEINSKVMMRFTWVDIETGDKDENLFGANGQNDWDKGVGSALTYGERYFLLKFFHIATDEDDIDNPERKTSAPVQQLQAEVQQIKEPANALQIADLKNLLSSHVYTDAERADKLPKLAGLNANQAEKLIIKLKAEIKSREDILQNEYHNQSNG